MEQNRSGGTASLFSNLAIGGFSLKSRPFTIGYLEEWVGRRASLDCMKEKKKKRLPIPAAGSGPWVTCLLTPWSRVLLEKLTSFRS
jgi:hypothetical protein